VGAAWRLARVQARQPSSPVRQRLSELELRQELDGWRRVVAGLIVEVLRACACDKTPVLYVERGTMKRLAIRHRRVEA